MTTGQRQSAEPVDDDTQPLQPAPADTSNFSIDVDDDF